MIGRTNGGLWRQLALLGAPFLPAAAWASRNVQDEYLTIPLPVLLSALAGAGLVLSFLPLRLGPDGQPQGRLRTLGTVLFCTLGAALATSRTVQLLAGQDQIFAHADMLVAFMGAAALQILIPLVAEDPKRAAAWVVDLLPWRKKP